GGEVHAAESRIDADAPAAVREQAQGTLERRGIKGNAPLAKRRRGILVGLGEQGGGGDDPRPTRPPRRCQPERPAHRIVDLCLVLHLEDALGYLFQKTHLWEFMYLKRSIFIAASDIANDADERDTVE